MLKKKKKKGSRDVISLAALLPTRPVQLRTPVAAGAGSTALPTSFLLCEQ